MQLITLFSCRPPSNRIQEKVMIPQDANPAINFIGLLIGPRYVSTEDNQLNNVAVDGSLTEIKLYRFIPCRSFPKFLCFKVFVKNYHTS